MFTIHEVARILLQDADRVVAVTSNCGQIVIVTEQGRIYVVKPDN